MSLTTNINLFLMFFGSACQKHCDINSNVREEIAEAAIELIGNAIEHSASDNRF